MMDLMYFGYPWDKEAAQWQHEFVTEVKEKFPNVKLKDAYDSIKGYRQEVWLDDNQEDDFMSFLFGCGWFELSLTLQINMMSADKHDKVKTWINLAKEQYPQNFKNETEVKH